MINDFPGKKVIQRWLKMGYVEGDTLYKTEKGTPQGGIISPLLANISLHGMETELGIKSGIAGPIGMVRYADDFVVACKTKEQAEQIYDKLAPYLTVRGIELSPEKTKITHILEGFDFLGFNLRQYERNNKISLLVKPSKDSIKKAKEKIKECFQNNRGQPIHKLLEELNPIIRGYANYWRHGVSSKVYTYMDNYVFEKTLKHLKGLHPTKSRTWTINQYFRLPKFVRKDKWTLTCPKTNIQIIKFRWTKIERHTMVKQNNSPDDSELKEYWEKRDKKEFDYQNTMSRIKLAKKQNYVCPICRMSLQSEEALEIHHIQPKSKGGKDEYKNLQLLHTSCHIRLYQRMSNK